ncbi:helix-turn-helix domain-containing protein [Candidatus Micrarchaeota archaeon]|nr:helix-turn-helix domain-containing protein [Candidatus Micrarchaeota archaeon]
MWVARLKVWHANSYVVEKSKKLEGGYLNYYLNSFEKDGKTYLSRVAMFFGKDADKFIDVIRSDPRLTVDEIDGRQVFFTMPVTNVFHTLIMKRGVFFVKPVIAEKGVEHWTVGAHRKEDLKKLYERINSLKPKAWAEWVSLKKERLDLFTPNAVERLSEKQKWAFEQAVKNGYYTYPRKISLQDLAKQLKVPNTTMRIHLRKAEAKLLPVLGQSLVF